MSKRFTPEDCLGLKAMLAEPRLPKEPTSAMMVAMRAAWPDPFYTPTYSAMIVLCRALYAHLSSPVDDLDEIRRYGT